MVIANGHTSKHLISVYQVSSFERISCIPDCRVDGLAKCLSRVLFIFFTLTLVFNPLIPRTNAWCLLISRRITTDQTETLKLVKKRNKEKAECRRFELDDDNWSIISQYSLLKHLLCALLPLVVSLFRIYYRALSLMFLWTLSCLYSLDGAIIPHSPIIDIMLCRSFFINCSSGSKLRFMLLVKAEQRKSVIVKLSFCLGGLSKGLCAPGLEMMVTAR